MEEDNNGWLGWVIFIFIGVVIYLLFFKGGDSTKTETSTISPQQQQTQDKIDELEQKLKDKQDQIDEQKQKQEDYNDCINRWSDANDYIKPENVAFCRRTYLE